MRKNKPSFFERLTGSISRADIEDDGPVETEEAGKESSLPNWSSEEENDGELPIDMYQTPHEIIVKTMISGVRPEDLEISISREMVVIRGKRHEHHETSSKDFFHKELYWGTFSRTILLPAEVEAEESEAIEKHGLLTIRLPKINKEKVSNLKVKSL